MRDWLNKPYPFLIERLIVRVRVALFVFLFVFLFLAVFRPFDIENVISINLYLAFFLYSLTSAAAVFIGAELFIRLFPNFFTDRHWTIGKEMISMNLILLIVSVANGILGYNIELCPVGEVKTVWTSIKQDLIHTYAVGIFPVTILTTISYIVFLKRNLQKAAENNKQLDTRIKTAAPIEIVNEKVTVQSPANNNDFSFYLNDLLFVMSDGNYVEFHLEDEGNVRREIRRNTLSNIESQLQSYQFLFRSHRAYLVNLKKVVKSSGNAQGYELELEKTKQVVPVSRRNLSRFDELINSQN